MKDYRIKLPYSAKIEQSKPIKDIDYPIPDERTNTYQLYRMKLSVTIGSNETREEAEDPREECF